VATREAAKLERTAARAAAPGFKQRKKDTVPTASELRHKHQTLGVEPTGNTLLKQLAASTAKGMANTTARDPRVAAAAETFEAVNSLGFTTALDPRTMMMTQVDGNNTASASPCLPTDRSFELGNDDAAATTAVPNRKNRRPFRRLVAESCPGVLAQPFLATNLSAVAQLLPSRQPGTGASGGKNPIVEAALRHHYSWLECIALHSVRPTVIAPSFESLADALCLPHDVVLSLSELANTAKAYVQAIPSSSSSLLSSTAGHSTMVPPDALEQLLDASVNGPWRQCRQEDPTSSPSPPVFPPVVERCARLVLDGIYAACRRCLVPLPPQAPPTGEAAGAAATTATSSSSSSSASSAVASTTAMTMMPRVSDLGRLFPVFGCAVNARPSQRTDRYLHLLICRWLTLGTMDCWQWERLGLEILLPTFDQADKKKDKEGNDEAEEGAQGEGGEEADDDHDDDDSGGGGAANKKKGSSNVRSSAYKLGLKQMGLVCNQDYIHQGIMPADGGPRKGNAAAAAMGAGGSAGAGGGASWAVAVKRLAQDRFAWAALAGFQSVALANRAVGSSSSSGATSGTASVHQEPVLPLPVRFSVGAANHSGTGPTISDKLSVWQQKRWLHKWTGPVLVEGKAQTSSPPLLLQVAPLADKVWSQEEKRRGHAVGVVATSFRIEKASTTTDAAATSSAKVSPSVVRQQLHKKKQQRGGFGGPKRRRIEEEDEDEDDEEEGEVEEVPGQPQARLVGEVLSTPATASWRGLYGENLVWVLISHCLFWGVIFCDSKTVAAVYNGAVLAKWAMEDKTRAKEAGAAPAATAPPFDEQLLDDGVAADPVNDPACPCAFRYLALMSLDQLRAFSEYLKWQWKNEYDQRVPLDYDLPDFVAHPARKAAFQTRLLQLLRMSSCELSQEIGEAYDECCGTSIPRASGAWEAFDKETLQEIVHAAGPVAIYHMMKPLFTEGGRGLGAAYGGAGAADNCCDNKTGWPDNMFFRPLPCPCCPYAFRPVLVPHLPLQQQQQQLVVGETAAPSSSSSSAASASSSAASSSAGPMTSLSALLPSSDVISGRLHIDTRPAVPAEPLPVDADVDEDDKSDDETDDEAEDAGIEGLDLRDLVFKVLPEPTATAAAEAEAASIVAHETIQYCRLIGATDSEVETLVGARARTSSSASSRKQPQAAHASPASEVEQEEEDQEDDENDEEDEVDPWDPHDVTLGDSQQQHFLREFKKESAHSSSSSEPSSSRLGVHVVPLRISFSKRALQLLQHYERLKRTDWSKKTPKAAGRWPTTTINKDSTGSGGGVGDKRRKQEKGGAPAAAAALTLEATASSIVRTFPIFKGLETEAAVATYFNAIKKGERGAMATGAAAASPLHYYRDPKDWRSYHAWSQLAPLPSALATTAATSNNRGAGVTAASGGPPKNLAFAVVEAKAKGDHLNKHQAVWLRYFDKCNILSGLVWVQPLAAFETSGSRTSAEATVYDMRFVEGGGIEALDVSPKGKKSTTTAAGKHRLDVSKSIMIAIMRRQMKALGLRDKKRLAAWIREMVPAPAPALAPRPAPARTAPRLAQADEEDEEEGEEDDDSSRRRHAEMIKRAAAPRSANDGLYLTGAPRQTEEEIQRAKKKKEEQAALMMQQQQQQQTKGHGAGGRR
jgi:hypothetical protein